MKKLLFAFAALLVLASCTETKKSRITVFYTSDEHGWFADNEKADGAAGMLQKWRDVDGYNEADSFLVLSGGDMWTGAAESTWFNGRSMIEVMNYMGYDAAALGNHEFDFTVDTLMSRLDKLNFPIIAANIVEKETGKVPSFVKPYHLVEANGLTVGLLGLASQSTPQTANPTYVDAFEFTSYAKAVDTYAPEMKKAGADFIIVQGHICKEEMEALSATAAKYGIPLITGGHCHQLVNKEENGVKLIETNSYLRNYIKVVIEFDSSTEKATVISTDVQSNEYELAAEDLQPIIRHWKDKADEALNIVIGYNAKEIEKSSVTMQKIVAGSWLIAFPDMDVAITNDGGIRQNMFVGEVTLGDIIGLLPFNNHLIKLTFTGAQIKKAAKGYIVAGVNEACTHFEDGTVIEDDKVYNVMTTDYLHSVKENGFSTYDPTMEDTYVLYRQPTIDWIESMDSSKKNPIQKHLK